MAGPGRCHWCFVPSAPMAIITNTTLAALFASQHGVASHAQAVERGATRARIRYALRTGSLVRVQPGVYRLNGAPPSPRQSLLAAVLAAGGDAVASHRSAAALHGLPGFRDGPIEITVQRHRTRRLRDATLRESRVLAERHRSVVDAIPTTTLARTLFDLAGQMHPLRTERALDHALARSLVSMPKCWDTFLDLAERGRAGTVVMRDLLTARGEGYVAPESALEALFLRVIRRYGLPMPERQRDLGSPEVWIGRVDFVYTLWKLIIEVDGRMYHTALLDRAADDRRDNRFVAEGYGVLRFSWANLTERPDECVRLIEKRIRQAAA